MDLDQVPVIDLAPITSRRGYGDDTPSDENDWPPWLVEEVRAACRDAGFFYVKNHGVSPSLIEEAFAACRSLFEEAPVEERRKVAAHLNPLWRGYLGLGDGGDACAAGREGDEATDGIGSDAAGMGKAEQRESVARMTADGRDPSDQEEETNAVHELKESFVVGAENADDSVKESPMHGPNAWPDESAFPDSEASAIWRRKHGSWQECVRRYWRASLRLSRTIAEALALALGLPRRYFADSLRNPCAQMVLLRYPPQRARGGDGPGCGAHTDCGFLTVLAQDRGGLEVHSRKAGGWVRVPPLEGTLIVNLGDMLELWSGGAYKSTRHRVLRHLSDGGGARYSIPFFVNCDFHTRLDELPMASTLEGREKMTTSGRYIMERLGLDHLL